MQPSDKAKEEYRKLYGSERIVALGDILTAGARNCLIVGGQRHIAAVRRLKGERRDELLQSKPHRWKWDNHMKRS